MNEECTRRGRCFKLECVLSAALVLLVIVAAVPLLRNLNRISLNPDWIMHYAFHRMARDAILIHGEYPLWSPHFGGGFPVCGHPENPLPSPLFLPTLLFGEVIGTKLTPAFVWVIGALGMYLFARTGGRCEPFGAFAAAAVLALSSWFPQRLLSGNYNETAFFLFPAVLAFYALAVRFSWAPYGIAASLIVAVTLIDGKTCNLVLALMLLGWAAIASMTSQGRRIHVRSRPWSILVALGVGAILLAMVKIAPMVEVTMPFLAGRRIPYHHAVTQALGEEAGHSLVWILKHFVLLERSDHAGASLQYAYHFIGTVPAMLLLVSTVVAWRRVWPWLVALGFTCLLIMGAHAPVNLFGLLRRLPGFGFVLGPAKYFSFPLLFCAATICGLGVSAIRRKTADRRFLALAALGLVLAAIQWIDASWTILDGAFDVKLPQVNREPDFFQVRRRRDVYRTLRTSRSNQYFNVIRNVGTIDWNSAFMLPENAIPRFVVDRHNRAHEVPAYPGEVWVAEGRASAELREMNSNSIEVKVNAENDSESVVVVNQNYRPGWRCDSGEVTSRRGRLALRLSSQPSERITLCYRPLSFSVGLAISLATVIGAAAWLILGRWRGANPKHSDADPPAAKTKAAAKGP